MRHPGFSKTPSAGNLSATQRTHAFLAPQVHLTLVRTIGQGRPFERVAGEVGMSRTTAHCCWSR